MHNEASCSAADVEDLVAKVRSAMWDVHHPPASAPGTPMGGSAPPGAAPDSTPTNLFDELSSALMEGNSEVVACILRHAEADTIRILLAVNRTFFLCGVKILQARARMGDTLPRYRPTIDAVMRTVALLRLNPGALQHPSIQNNAPKYLYGASPEVFVYLNERGVKQHHIAMEPPLLGAARVGNLELVRWLWEQAPTDGGALWATIGMATRQGHGRVLQYLLSLNPPTTEQFWQTRQYRTLMAKGDPVMINMLLDRSEAVRGVTKHHILDMTSAMCSAGDVCGIRRLQRLFAQDVWLRDELKYLYKALNSGSESACMFLATYMSDATLREGAAELVRRACKLPSPRFLNSLLSRIGPPSYALQHACASGQSAHVKCVLKYLDESAICAKIPGAVAAAARSNRFSWAVNLLCRDRDLATIPRVRSLLPWACLYGDATLVKKILHEAEASPAEDSPPDRMEGWACQGGSPRVAQLLSDHLPGCFGLDRAWMVFVRACRAGKPDLVRWVCDHYNLLGQEGAHLVLEEMVEFCGSLEAVRWVYEQLAASLAPDTHRKLMLKASLCGHNRVARWIRETHLQDMPRRVVHDNWLDFSKAFKAACKRGDLLAAQWLHSEFGAHWESDCNGKQPVAYRTTVLFITTNPYVRNWLRDTFPGQHTARMPSAARAQLCR